MTYECASFGDEKEPVPRTSSIESSLVAALNAAPLSVVKAPVTESQPIGQAPEALRDLNNMVVEKARKMSHPRIKYSGVNPAPLVPTKEPTLSGPMDSKPMELAPPLNLDNIFPHVMSTGAAFAQHPLLARAISADDMSGYADIDDIELPDGTKIGYPTDLRRFSNPSGVQQHNPLNIPTSHPPPPHYLHQQLPQNQVPAASVHYRHDPDTWLHANKSANNSRLSYSSDGGGDHMLGGGNGDDPLEIYACRHCGKRYRWKSTLRRHENDECGDKKPAHECPYCPYKAKQRGNLGVHVRKHHSDQPQLESRRKRRSAFEMGGLNGELQ